LLNIFNFNKSQIYSNLKLILIRPACFINKNKFVSFKVKEQGKLFDYYFSCKYEFPFHQRIIFTKNNIPEKTLIKPFLTTNANRILTFVIGLFINIYSFIALFQFFLKGNHFSLSCIHPGNFLHNFFIGTLFILFSIHWKTYLDKHNSLTRFTLLYWSGYCLFRLLHIIFLLMAIVTMHSHLDNNILTEVIQSLVGFLIMFSITKDIQIENQL
jgi:hypothetical protein